MANETPKLCPFCGGKPIADSQKRLPDGPDDTAYYIRCLSCAAQGGWAKYPGNAITLWNLRVAEAAPTEFNEAAELARCRNWMLQNPPDEFDGGGSYAKYAERVWLAKAREAGR